MDEIKRLNQFIIDSYSLEEFKTLCFHLTVQYDDLGSQTISGKTRDLLLLLREKNELDDLLEYLSQSRPERFREAGFEVDSNLIELLYRQIPEFESQTKPFYQKMLNRIGFEQRISFALLAGISVVLILILYIILKPNQPRKMTGDFRIAVAGFAENDFPKETDLGMELAQGVYLRLKETFDELNPEFSVTVWGPEQVGAVIGENADERAEEAAKIAEEVQADIVVYGHIDSTEQVWTVAPEFFTSADNFYEAAEITGPHALGTPISIDEKVAGRIDTSEGYSARTQILSNIIIGLSYYSVRQYETALEFLESAENVNYWDENEGKEVLYVIIGNTAGKFDDLPTAEAYHQKSLLLDPQYARARIGLASTYYLLALQPFRDTRDIQETDSELLKQAIAEYELAENAENQPPLANISTKVHFGMGQCYLMQTLSGYEARYDRAIIEFEAVIDDYSDGAAPQLREFAAESYAGLALIYIETNNINLAINQYEKAITLLSENPERKAFYEERLHSLKNEPETITQ